MTIAELLTFEGLRIEYDNKWLVGGIGDPFVVYQHRYRAKKHDVLYDGDDIDLAIKILTKES
jgi:hypothetical protein